MCVTGNTVWKLSKETSICKPRRELLTTRFWAFSLQCCEEINFCCLSYPVCDILLMAALANSHCQYFLVCVQDMGTSCLLYRCKRCLYSGSLWGPASSPALDGTKTFSFHSTDVEVSVFFVFLCFSPPGAMLFSCHYNLSVCCPFIKGFSLFPLR